MDRPCGGGGGGRTRNASFQIKKKTAVYTQLFVLVQYKQNKKSLLSMVSKHPILKRRGDTQRVDEAPQWWAGCLALQPSPERQRAQL